MQQEIFPIADDSGIRRKLWLTTLKFCDVL